nr:hypothetical protein [Tanacetum cinerariifolium]
MRADELYKFSDGTLKKVRDELHHRVLDFDLGYNKETERRKWTITDKKRSALMVELIDKQMRERRIIRNLERLVGARELEMDYKLMTRTRLDITLGPRYEVGESSSAAARPARGLRADYGFVATVDREIMRDPEREDTDEIYMRLDDEQTERQLLAGRLNMLFRDRRAHAYTCHLMETEARMSRKAWVRATDASDLVHGEVMHYCTRIDHRRSTEISKLRTALQGHVTALQGQVTALQAQVTKLQGQQGLAGGPTQSELPEEAGGKRISYLSGTYYYEGNGGQVKRLEDTERQLLAGRLNMLFRDRRAHAYTRHLMETEARMSRKAWVRATDASDLVHGEVMSLRTTVLGQMSEIRELQAADRRRQTVISELLRIDHMRSTEISKLRTALQGHAMIDQGVTAALAAHDALRSTNGNDSHNSETGVRRTERATHECTYTDFLKCQPLPFKGTEGVANLSQWCEKIEPLVMKPLTVKGTDLASYTQRYQELALLCGRMFSKESDKIEKYVRGLPDMIHESVVASKPKTMQEAIEIATELMDKKIRTFAERETATKRKFENTSRNTQNQQQQHSNKRQNTGRVYTAASGEKKQYVGSRPLCAKCNYHHDGPCAPKCRNCNKIGHLARDCRNTANTNNVNNQRGTGLGHKTACYECGVQGHYRRECPKLRNNNNHGNQSGRNNAPARVYAVGHAGTDPDANVVTVSLKMPCGSTFETTISLRICLIIPLSIRNVCVAKTSAVVGKVPYFVTLVALGTRTIVMKIALGALGQIPTVWLLLTCLHIIDPGNILPFGGLLLVTMAISE